MLSTDDIPERHARNIEDEVAYPRSVRYTLQHLCKLNESTAKTVGENNSDATFRKRGKRPKPSALLLHYNYGAAALKLWGKGTKKITERPNIPRPAIPSTSKLGPDQTRFDHGAFRRKLAGQEDDNENNGNNEPQGGQDGQEEVEELDEDDLMLFFWANTRVATERREKAAREKNDYITSWRSSVPIN
jgi:hypothetical protein